MPARQVKLRLEDLPRRQQELAAHLPEVLQRGFLAGALACLPVLHAKTRQVEAVNTGQFLRSWKSRALPSGAAVFNDAPYAAIVEHGRRAGARMPPREPIVRWAQRKLGLTEAEARAASWSIARAISRRGIAARRVLAASEPELERVVRREVLRELDAELGR